MNKKTILNRIAAVLSFVIGAMAVFAGGKVLLGSQPDYYVIDWLVRYNFLIGILSAFLTAPVLWRSTRLALPFGLATFGMHALVMLILQTAYRQVVAADSLQAMTVRLAVWTIVLILLFIQQAIRHKQGGRP